MPLAYPSQMLKPILLHPITPPLSQQPPTTMPRQLALSVNRPITVVPMIETILFPNLNKSPPNSIKSHPKFHHTIVSIRAMKAPPNPLPLLACFENVRACVCRADNGTANKTDTCRVDSLSYLILFDAVSTRRKGLGKNQLFWFHFEVTHVMNKHLLFLLFLYLAEKCCAICLFFVSPIRISSSWTAGHVTSARFTCRLFLRTHGSSAKTSFLCGNYDEANQRIGYVAQHEQHKY